MATSFYVVMQKRCDGKIYADLHKTTERIFFFEEDAKREIDNIDDEIRNSFHVVELVAMTMDEFNEHNQEVAYE